VSVGPEDKKEREKMEVLVRDEDADKECCV